MAKLKEGVALEQLVDREAFASASMPTLTLLGQLALKRIGIDRVAGADETPTEQAPVMADGLETRLPERNSQTNFSRIRPMFRSTNRSLVRYGRWAPKRMAAGTLDEWLFEDWQLIARALNAATHEDSDKKG